MKRKRNTYILLAVVLTIWGLLLYKVFSYSSPQPHTETLGTVMQESPLQRNVDVDTFSLAVNYRDPFLGKPYRRQKETKKTKTRLRPVSIQWPEITYQGIVSDSREKNKVFMVMIGGKSFFMRERQKEEEILLYRGNRREIIVE